MEEELLEHLKELKALGFGYNNSKSIRLKIESHGSSNSFEKIRSFSGNHYDDISTDVLFDVYFIQFQLYNREEDVKSSLISIIKAIYFRPELKELRIIYLDTVIDFIISNRFDEKQVFQMRHYFKRFLSYSKMKWGKESALISKGNYILELLEDDTFLTKKSSDEISDFIENWLQISIKYRPKEEALDYASQAIYESMV